MTLQDYEEMAKNGVSMEAIHQIHTQDKDIVMSCPKCEEAL